MFAPHALAPVASPPPELPLVVFDGDCSFCRRWIARFGNLTADRIDYEPFQSAAPRFPEIPVSAFQQAVHLIEPNGHATRGAHAVFRTLALAAQKRWLLWMYAHLPGFAFVTEFLYRFVARHRNGMDLLDRWLIGTQTAPSRYYISRFIFLRLLGAVYLVAFISLWSQIDGLVGSKGILPIQSYLHAAHSQLQGASYRQLPTLLWFNASDSALHYLCGSGVALSILLIIGIAPVPVLTLLWACYLSLTVAGQIFLGFQWDVLLLEAGFLAIFFAPWQILPRPSRQPPPPRVALWLLRWLLFRVMFLSGVLKLSSGDPAWRHLTALCYHYETQPLPTWTSWYFHQFPLWFQMLSALFMFYAEILAPLMIFGPRRVRLLGFWSILLLQLLIVATGNFGFFNLLTIVLCTLLPDDAFWPPRWRLPAPSPHARLWRCPAWLTVPPAIFIIAITSIPLAEAFVPVANLAPGQPPIRWPDSVNAVRQWLAPFRTFNGYGLFRVMTVDRPEIIIEGSDDQQTWLPYTFKWKPGDVNRAPAFCTPHMPRLDWQMWFSALNDGHDIWLFRFTARLLQGSPPVLALLDHTPFPNHPPHYIRAVLYDYRFTDWPTGHATGAWWQRNELHEIFRVEPRDGKSIFHFPPRDGRYGFDAQLPADN